MVATRRLQLTVKKATRNQKTLEGSLLIVRDGIKESASTRVAELDQVIPQYLGVSKAILENVIFCHQDDSLWPMSEPSVLKKKFDEIFEALKYTKAIDNIKILRKKQNEELGKLKIIEQHAKEDKEKGDRAERKSTALYDEIETLRAEVGDVEGRVDEAEQKSRDAFNHAARFEQDVAQLNGKRITLQANQASVNELENIIDHMLEPDEELQSMLDQYEKRVTEYEERMDALRQRYGGYKHDLEERRRASGIKQGEIGKFKAEKEQYERQVLKRENLIKETAKHYGVRGFDYDLADEQIANFMQIIDQMSKEQEKALGRARQETQEERRNAQTEVNQLNERKSSLAQRKEMSRSQIATNDRRISDLQKNMDQIQIDEGGEATIKEKKNQTEQQLRNARSEADSEQFDDRVHKADAALRTLDEEKEKLDAEMVDATKLARDSAQVDLAQDDLKAANQSLATMKGVHHGRISKLVDSDWDPSTLEATFQKVLSQKAAKVKEAESRREIAQTNLANLNFKMSSNESELKNKRSQFKKYQELVLEAIRKDDISDFEETLQALEEQYEMASADQAKFQANIDYMQGCLQTAEDDDVCRLCRRTLRDNKAEHFTKAGFIARLEAIIEKAKQNMGGAENLDDLFSELEAVRNAKPSYELAIRLRDTELPALQSDASRLSLERDAVNKLLEEHDAIIDDLQSSKVDVESLSKSVQSIVNYYTQARELEVKIRDLTEKQKAAGLSRGINAIQEDLKKIGEEIRSAKSTLAHLTAGRDKSRNLINTLELRIRDINADLNSAQSKLKEKRALDERIEEFKAHNNEQRDAIRGFDKEIEGLVPQIGQAQAKYEDVDRRGSERVQRLQDEASSLSDSVRQLSYAEHEIDAYIKKGGPAQLDNAQQDIKDLEGEIARIDEDMVGVTRQVKKIEDTLRDTVNTKRSLSDNLRYRKAKRELQTLEVEIEELESHNAEQDKERYEREGHKWQNEWTRLTTQRASLMGTIKTKDDSLKELIDEWETEYKDAAVKYREAHIKVETTKAAVEDLGRYGGALDKAIMKYHTLKMEEINGIIEELWKNAYQGTDVDTIRIRSDNETAKGNRSYNYRVVMVKQETEMDMRGRCSAGQKVLASIVIRLALAECFGTNCGLIALDEPTTNLDQQNIKGLAESLSEIIKIRRKQANFQLIVITHDEQFLREMNCADYTDVYWRVGRNDEQTSIIERQMISEVSVQCVQFKQPIANNVARSSNLAPQGGLACMGVRRTAQLCQRLHL